MLLCRTFLSISTDICVDVDVYLFHVILLSEHEVCIVIELERSSCEGGFENGSQFQRRTLNKVELWCRVNEMITCVILYYFDRIFTGCDALSDIFTADHLHHSP